MLARRLFSSSTSSTFPQSHFGQPVYFRTAASFFFFFSSPDLDGAGAGAASTISDDIKPSTTGPGSISITEPSRGTGSDT